MYTSFSMQAEIDQLRDEVTRFSSAEDKHTGYKEVYELSKNTGYFDRMIEVSRFAFGSRSIPKEDYRICLGVAFYNRDLRSFVLCKKALGEEVTHEEVEEFGLGKGTPVFMTLELLALIKKNIPTDNLSPKEWATVSRTTSALR